ncbi:lytic transglycosylase domain-containing protein [Bradyrhizobium sp. CB82]|uniref:lytic transglycosylase domain-containing protein n=1 Tax=Bradyrhizobium sp. CB82 TaxID=3039159 RepID=UPI0024B097CE|nr:lytic transglycosylase domain-containing protein [Bradyrhizobium sp. CB82]WFU43548.1 lytic transglycosylase domain-containing protein [Bradyrhizobium sp. CB82]
MTEASRRFAIPEHWIRTVMKVESGGNAQAISPRGALGLMQIMPETWVELSVRYEFSSDPFDPRENILAGTAYLREMLDRFGLEGFLAAYNAGPGRYEQLLATGRRLPEETLVYVRTIQSEIGIERGQSGAPLTVPAASRLRDAPSVGPSTSSSAGNRSATIARQIGRSGEMPNADVSALIPRATGLFVQFSSAGSSR